MKNFVRSLSLLVFLAASLPVFSQMMKAGKVDLLVAETVLGQGIGFQYQEKVDQRVWGVVKTEGVSVPVYNVFILVPSLELMPEKKVDTLEGFIELPIRLRFLVKNALTGLQISSHETEITAIGRSKDEAFVRALPSIKKTNGELRRAVNTCRQDVRDYFLSKSDSVLVQVTRLLAANENGQAFLLANSLPDDAPKAEAIQKLRATAFENFQKTACSAALGAAQAAIDLSQPPRAVEILSVFDPVACGRAEEVKNKLAELQTKLDDPTKNRWAWLFENWLKNGDPKLARARAEAEMCRETLAGEAAKMKFID